MKEEIRKHSKKIWYILRKPNKSFFEKLKEVAIEISIIVFAVTLSIGLHSWSEHNHNKEKVREFAIDLLADLESDRKINKVVNDNLKEALNEVISNANLNQDAQFTNVFRFPSNGNFEGFKSSGNIGLIENKNFKKKLLQYYQQSVPSLTLIESMTRERANKLTNALLNEPLVNRKVLHSKKYQKITEDYINILKVNIQYNNQNTANIIQLEQEIKNMTKE